VLFITIFGTLSFAISTASLFRDGFSYYVRVVATAPSTRVVWETENNATDQLDQLVSRGQFIQIYNPHASTATRVVCDKPCLVMQYNPGTPLSTTHSVTVT